MEMVNTAVRDDTELGGRSFPAGLNPVTTLVAGGEPDMFADRHRASSTVPSYEPVVSRQSGSSSGSTPVQSVREMSKREYVQYLILCTAFVGATIYFWHWWLALHHIGNWILFGIRSWIMFYLATLLPAFYLLFLGQMKRPVLLKARSMESVALVTLTVPGSESLEIVERQLIAMSRVRYPHESWILVDRVHSPEIVALAARYGVQYFSRHDVDTWGDARIARWNQAGPPFQAKTKAGNVNAALEAWRLLGKQYGFFVQFDIDHNPEPEYVHKVLGFFRDEHVAWVQSPSVIKNSRDNWIARGAIEQEYVLQGVLQRGFYGMTNTPMIIGSHCAYRLSAVEEIGGFQPTRAEDHLDTLCLAAAGWKGVYLPEIIAWGDGPEDFGTYTKQQFAWAFSMFQVLQEHTPKMLGKLSRLQRIQFLFTETWYVLWGSSMFAAYLLPVIALLLNTPTSYVPLVEFLAHAFPRALAVASVWWWSRKWFVPEGAPILTWRGIILHIARWPSVLSAVLQAALHVKKPYMITSKGMAPGKWSFDLVSYLPFVCLVTVGIGSVQLFIVRFGRSATQGEVVFTLIGVLMVMLVFLVALLQDLRHLVPYHGILKALGSRLIPIVSLFLMTLSLIATTYVAYPLIKEAALFGSGLNVP